MENRLVAWIFFTQMSQTEKPDKHEEKGDEEIKTERNGEGEAGIKED